MPPDDGPPHPVRRIRLARPAVPPTRAAASGWAYPFRPEPWDEIESLYARLLVRRPELDHMLAIASSVRASDVAKELAAFTISHTHDLMVRPLPPVDPPYDVVAPPELPRSAQ